MTDKEQYYKLDDIGFVGTQKRVSQAQQKKEMEMTRQWINAMRAGKPNPFAKKKKVKYKRPNK
jgi:hypothetical protein